MAYQRTTWKDHVVERPKTYTVTENSDGTQTHVDAPGEVIQLGTPMSATNFNNLEEGLQYAAIAFDYYFMTSQAKQRDLETRLAVAEAQLAALTP